MGSRRFLSWPAGWAKAMPWGILVGLTVGASLIVAQGLGSGWSQIDWCGASIVIFFVVVAVTAFTARLRRDRSQDDKPPDAADINILALVELGKCHLRVARPSDDLDAVVKFYRDGLGFTVLYRFKDHDGFDGVMLGHKGADYHLEFTRKHGHKAGKAPTEDNLLVFYLPDEADWKRALDQMERHGHRPVKSFNPYWDKNGKTFEDPDGYRVVLQHATWPG